jgi:hypothetical protein
MAGIAFLLCLVSAYHAVGEIVAFLFPVEQRLNLASAKNDLGSHAIGGEGPMNRKLKAAAAAGLSLASIAITAGPAEAARYRFGTDERLYAYAKTGIVRANKPVALCYKTSTYNLFAPVYTTDEKVLCNVESNAYWPVPKGEELRNLQAAGLMPKPVPDYKRPIFDYLMGYLLWVVLAGVGAFFGVSALASHGKSEDGSQERSA